MTEAQHHRLVLARLVATLGIPAEGEDGPTRRGGARGVYKMGRR
jgi:hypothetical protein